MERAAIELFAAHGVDGVSIADIAAAAEVSQGALYRHYRGKDQLARELFAAAYHRTGAELAAICRIEPQFAARIGAMVEHFCMLYDRDAALFRFMLLAQHELLPGIDDGGTAPVAAIEAAITAATEAGELPPTDPPLAAATIMGIVLQTALFHLYRRIGGSLVSRAPALTRAALAAIAALVSPKSS